MESNPNEDDSKSSSEEEETDHHMGTGRSYECVFCKRGFTTAQALGGHMNIHRKDRAKNRPQTSSSSISNKFVDDNNFDNNYNHHHHQYFAMASEVHVNYQTYFPASPDNNNHSNNYDSYGKNKPQHLNAFGDEVWRGNLALRAGESDHHHHVAADHDKEKRQGVVGEEDDELDLELRLGHHDP